LRVCGNTAGCPQAPQVPCDLLGARGTLPSHQPSRAEPALPSTLARPPAMAAMAVSHPTAPGDAPKWGKLPKVLGDAAGAAVDAGNWPLFRNGEARGASLCVLGDVPGRGRLVLHGASPSWVRGWERQGPAARDAAKTPAHSTGAC